MAIFLGVSAAQKHILLSEFSSATVQHSLSQPESFIVTGKLYDLIHYLSYPVRQFELVNVHGEVHHFLESKIQLLL